jgi:hypothetical protein
MTLVIHQRGRLIQETAMEHHGPHSIIENQALSGKDVRNG